MSFVEKALKRLKDQQPKMAPLGRLDDQPSRRSPLDPGGVLQGSQVPGGADAGFPDAETQVLAAGHPFADDAATGAPDADGPDVREGKRVTIDRARLREEGFLAPDEYEKRMADEYRRIKRPVLANAFGVGATRVEKGNLVLVTSALSGEGKTHTCINLALSLATELERTVMLIDGDVAKPHISRLFGIDQEPGLLDVLGDRKVTLEDVIVRTDIPRLRVIPAGSWRDQANELLSSDRMLAVCNELCSRYSDRIILFDSPPLLAAPEAQAISAAVGQVVLLIAENTTARDDVRAALALIDEQKAVNAILNKSRSSGWSGYYGAYGYSHGYGSTSAPPAV